MVYLILMYLHIAMIPLFFSSVLRTMLLTLLVMLDKPRHQFLSFLPKRKINLSS